MGMVWYSMMEVKYLKYHSLKKLLMIFNILRTISDISVIYIYTVDPRLTGMVRKCLVPDKGINANFEKNDRKCKNIIQ